MGDLSKKKCVSCEGGTPPFTEEEIAKYVLQLKDGWDVLGRKKLQKEFKFKDFKEAMVFVNAVAGIAETENHHPDVLISWNQVIIELWTHKIGGLSENDFILAAKIDTL